MSVLKSQNTVQNQVGFELTYLYCFLGIIDNIFEKSIFSPKACVTFDFKVIFGGCRVMAPLPSTLPDYQ